MSTTESPISHDHSAFGWLPDPVVTDEREWSLEVTGKSLEKLINVLTAVFDNGGDVTSLDYDNNNDDDYVIPLHDGPQWTHTYRSLGGASYGRGVGGNAAS